MTLPDLATLADVEERLGRNLSPSEHSIVSRLLADASASVRLYTGQTFTQVVNDVAILKIRRGKVRLPQRPVTAVSAVRAALAGATALPFWWDGLETVSVTPNVPNSFSYEPLRGDVNTAQVTYTHGYADGDLPAALVGLVVQIVGRALGTELIQTGITQESIAGYQYAIGGAAAAAGFGLLPAEKDALDKFCRRGGVVRTGL